LQAKEAQRLSCDPAEGYCEAEDVVDVSTSVGIVKVLTEIFWRADLEEAQACLGWMGIQAAEESVAVGGKASA
jgi:hypothetical protein